ncbi:helix-turn-helix domain-containing protein [Microbacterium sp. YY-01]|uniref:helix-turn-helix domain-containing protein n=1 Tax=Microbacterium sp. YY-01 TaxID=3421634 RepID=UPI003D16A7ED
MAEADGVDVTHLEQLADSLIESHDALLEALIRLREKHNLSQNDIAERMGVSLPTVIAFERYDANPKLSTIRRYALAVGASISHSVSDACCDVSESRFDSIIGNGDRWRAGTRRSPAKWPAGAVNGQARVVA